MWSLSRAVALIVAGSLCPPSALAQAEADATELATVCFRRAAGASGWAVPLAVRRNGHLMERFSVGNQRCFTLKPGPQEFGALYWGRTKAKTTRPAATVNVLLAPGDCRYFRVIMGFSGVLLTEVDQRHFREPNLCSTSG